MVYSGFWNGFAIVSAAVVIAVAVVAFVGSLATRGVAAA